MTAQRSRAELASEAPVKGVRAVERTLAILDAFTVDRLEPSLQEVSATVRLPKSTTHRLLQTLVACGLVERGSESNSYRLSLRAARLGAVAMWDRAPADEVHQILRTLRTSTGETVGLNVRQEGMSVVVDRAESWHPISANIRIGSTLPWHASGAGKTLLAGLSDDEVEALLPRSAELERFTRQTIASVDDLRDCIRAVRRDGFAIDDCELADGLRCVAVPVHDSPHGWRYALGVSGPAARLSIDDLRALVEPLTSAATAIAPFVALLGSDRQRAGRLATLPRAPGTP